MKLIHQAFVATVALAFTAACSDSPNPTEPISFSVDPVICEGAGDFVWNGTSFDMALGGTNDLGSKKFETTGDPKTIEVTAPAGYLISGFCYKAGTQTYSGTVDPGQQTYLLAPDNRKGVSHFVMQFVQDQNNLGEWCSPGFWRANATKHNANQWPVPTNTLYKSVITTPVPSGNPTLLQVLNAPKTYFGAANQGAGFQAVATYLSEQKGLNVLFDTDGNPIHNCPLDQQGN